MNVNISVLALRFLAPPPHLPPSRTFLALLSVSHVSNFPSLSISSFLYQTQRLHDYYSSQRRRKHDHLAVTAGSVHPCLSTSSRRCITTGSLPQTQVEEQTTQYQEVRQHSQIRRPALSEPQPPTLCAPFITKTTSSSIYFSRGVATTDSLNSSDEPPAAPRIASSSDPHQTTSFLFRLYSRPGLMNSASHRDPEDPPLQEDQERVETPRPGHFRGRVNFVPLYHRSTSPRSHPSRSRRALHRVLNTLFNNIDDDSDESEPDREGLRAEPGPVANTPEAYAFDPSNGDDTTVESRQRPIGLLRRRSTQSLEFVVPGAFIFSGPDLRDYASSFTESLGPSRSSLCLLTDDGNWSVEALSLRARSRQASGESFQTFERTNDIARSSGRTSDTLERPIASATSTNGMFQASGISRLPNEILQQIHSHLCPRDFDASRRTCRGWMSACLDRGLLISMLKRGGWWSSAEVQLSARRRARHPSLVNEEWFLSRVIARECSLQPTWGGNGLSTVLHPNESQAPSRAMVQTAQYDFSDLSSGYAGREGRHSGLVFTASVCGQFLLVAEGSIIYVYGLIGRILRPVTSVLCPRRVVAMSMDVSCGRFAVAALLSGRMGLVCDLHDLGSTSASPLATGDTVQHNTGHHRSARNSLFTSRLYPTDDRTSLPNRSQRLRGSDQYSDLEPNRNPSPQSDIEITSSPDRVRLSGSNGYSLNWVNTTWNVRLHGSEQLSQIVQTQDNLAAESQSDRIPVEDGPRIVYRQICADDDPPRSVAICPHRRCVAFGCERGAELHWVDAVSGHDLNRWFPLTSPSDFLYFLQPRRNEPKTLRVISSAAHPGQQSEMEYRAAGQPGRAPFDARSSCTYTWSLRPSFWGSFGAEQRPTTLDSYRAVPFGDGYHTLFTDPASETLWLGNDAPLGGPIRLLRQIKLIPPDENAVPRMYTAAADLTWGPRIVAVYGDRVVLYCVPPDVFAAIVRQTHHGDDSFLWDGNEWLDWWWEGDWPREERPSSAFSIWPLRIQGIVVGQLDRLIEVAVNQANRLTIWAFSSDGRAITWQLNVGEQNFTVLDRIVDSNGLVQNAPAAKGDEDIVVVEGDGERSTGFDGNNSMLLSDS